MTDLLPGFVAWLERKNPNERYHWPNSEVCACGQYAKHVGVQFWMAQEGWGGLNILARGPVAQYGDYEVADPGNWTFGKLLDRVKAIA